MRRAPLCSGLVTLVGAVTLAAIVAPSARALDIERVSSPVIYIDGDDRGMYAAYRVTNDDDVDHPALWVHIGQWRDGSHVGLAPREDGVTLLGPLARGDARTAYFYLTADHATTHSEQHAVSVFATDPSGPEPELLARAWFGHRVEDTEVADEVVITRVDLDPAAPLLGGELSVTATGRIPALHDTRELVYTPAAHVDWPAETFELIGVHLSIPGEVELDDALVWKAPWFSWHTRDAIFTYRFRVACAAAATDLALLAYIDPGCPRQHNDAALSQVSFTGPTQSALVLERAPVRSMIAAGAVEHHRLMVNNLVDSPARFDLIRELIVAPEGFEPMDLPAYLPGSTTLDGLPFSDPEITATTLTWTGPFELAPGRSLELAFAVRYPLQSGVFEHRAHGEVAAAGLACGLPSRIDATAALDDDAPAVAHIGVDLFDVLDDVVHAAQGTPLVLAIGDLVGNDRGVDLATFELATDTSQGGAPLTLDPELMTITYLAPDALGGDMFAYRICSDFMPSTCAEAHVTITINHQPTVPSRLVWAAVGAGRIVVPALGVGFADVDGDALASIVVLASPGGVASVTGEHMDFRPFDPTAAARHPIRLELCDDGLPPACITSGLTIVMNDPPRMIGLSRELAWRDVISVPLAHLVADLGLVVGDDPGDGDLDGIGPIAVGPSASGPWQTYATLDHGIRCHLDAAAIAIRAGGVSGDGACWVQVCEELPGDDPAVCARAVLAIHVSQCLDTADCRGGQACADGVCIDRPVITAVDDHYTTMPDVALVVADPGRGLLANDLVPDGLAAVVRLVPGTAPSAQQGGLAVAPNGTFRFVPAKGFRGLVTFTYDVALPIGVYSGASVYIDVRGEPPVVNLRPDAREDVVTTPEDTPVLVAVLDNDTDPNGDTLVVTHVVFAPHHGSAAVVDGAVRYVPAPDWYGDDAFVYGICDPTGACDAARVSVVVTSVNDPPLAIDDWAVTPEDTPVLMDVLANDRDIEGDTLSIVAIFPDKSENLAAGRPTWLADDSILYAPGPDRTGPLFFGYTVCDAGNACSNAIARVDATPTPDTPVAGDDGFVVVHGRQTLVPVLANDVDPDGDALVVTRIVDPPRFGRAVIVAGEPMYVSLGREVTDTFVYEACDATGRCAEAEATLFVGVRRAPLAIDDVAYGDGTRPIVIDVLGNDELYGHDTVEVRATTQPANPHGTATVDDGLVIYTPDRRRSVSESFTYTACDFRDACSTARVDIVIEGNDLAPFVLDELTSTQRGTATQIFVLGNDHDPEGGTLAIAAFGSPRHGTVGLPEFDVTGPARLVYVPEPGFTGTDWFPVSVADPAGGSGDSLVVVHVLARDNRTPRARNDVVHVRMAPAGSVLGYASEIFVRDNDDDLDNDRLTIVAMVMPEHGAVRFTERGNPMYVGAPGYFGPDHFTYAVEDGHGARDGATVELVVGDRDQDGLSDIDETQVTHTDPRDADSDDDRIDDAHEVAAGVPGVYERGVDTNPLDADTDDDGLADGTELLGDGPLATFAPTDPLVADSDHDLLRDGIEVGVTKAVPGGTSDVTMSIFAGTDLGVWRPDRDASTRTDPNDDDSDDDGLLDGQEDLNGDGAWSGSLGATNTSGIGELDPLDPDTDGDTLGDGLELGLVAPQGVGTDMAMFTPDLDPTTTTNPRDLDSDDGSVFDGAEDTNANGRVDRMAPGETDPTWGVDDVPSIVTGGGGSCMGGPTGGLSLLALLGLGLARRRARA